MLVNLKSVYDFWNQTTLTKFTDCIKGKSRVVTFTFAAISSIEYKRFLFLFLNVCI